MATWSRADQTYPPKGAWANQPIEAMARDVRAAYDKAAEASAVKGVIPVGEAWTRAMQTGVADPNPYDGIEPGKLNLWTYDHYHGSAYGYYLEALVIFGSLTGRDPRSLGDNECSGYELGFARAEVKALQQVAFDQLASTGAVTPRRWCRRSRSTLNAASRRVEVAVSVTISEWDSDTMGMVLELTTLADENIERILADPPLIWRVVAPDEPEFYEAVTTGASKAVVLGHTPGRKERRDSAVSRSRTSEPLKASRRISTRRGTGFTTSSPGLPTRATRRGHSSCPGGATVGDIEVGYGPARVFTSAETQVDP